MRLTFTLVFFTSLISISNGQNTAISVDSARLVVFNNPILGNKHADQIMETSRKTGDKVAYINGITLSGHAQYFMGKLDSALQLYLIAYDSAKNVNSRKHLIGAMLNIAYTYDRVGMHVLAKDLLDKSKAQLLPEDDLVRNDVNVYFGYHFQLLEELDSASHYYNLVDPDMIKHDATLGSFLTAQQANIAITRKEYEQADGLLQTAHSLAQKHGNNWDLINIALIDARRLYLTGEYQNAIDIADESLGLMNDTKIDIDKDFAYTVLYCATKQFGNYKLALDFFEKGEEEEKRLGEITKVTQQIALNSLKKNAEDDIVKAKLATSVETRNAKLRIRSATLIFVLTLLLIVSVLAYWIYRGKKQLSRAKLKIEKQRDDLKQLNTAKNKLFASLSHDLKNPITSITGILSLAKEEVINPEDFRNYASTMLNSTKRLTSQIENLLKWSRSQLDHMHVNGEEIDLSDLIKQCIEPLMEQANQKGQIVDIQKSAQSMAFADPNMLCIVINNIMSNAVKYTPICGRITISIAQKDNDLIVSFQDTGKGINKETTGKLFKGAVVSQAGTRKEKGSGIGLLLSYDLMVMNNGRLTVESDPGNGTTVSFIVPTSK
ncbi:MAG: HAMP domain-containing histidine kinase [Cyclobacteriaceae bacterium]